MKAGISHNEAEIEQAGVLLIPRFFYYSHRSAFRETENDGGRKGKHTQMTLHPSRVKVNVEVVLEA